MEPTTWLALIVIVTAVTAVARGVEVRISLLIAAVLLGLLAGDLPAVVRTFLETFSNEKFVVPICSAMGFAYVLKHTGCDDQMVRLLVEPVRRVRFLMLPGIVLVGFIVNIPVISQTSTAVCIGTVVVPVMRAAGFSPLAIGSALLLGSSVGGELLNPGAPELLTVKSRTETSTSVLSQQYLPQLVFPLLGISTAIFWLLTVRAERRLNRLNHLLPLGRGSESEASRGEGVSQGESERLRPWQALVPLVPLIVLFLSGPPFHALDIPQSWLAVATKDAPHPEKLASSRLIGLAMLLGVAVAALAVPRKAGGCMRAFFEGAGYGYANIISLIVVANCFGKGIEKTGLVHMLDELIRQQPNLLTPLAGFVPMAFAFVCGSGMASTQSLYDSFYDASAKIPNSPPDPNSVGAMVSVGAAVGRTLSPVAAVTLMCSKLTDTKPLDLVKRIAIPLLLGLSAVIALRVFGVV